MTNIDFPSPAVNGQTFQALNGTLYRYQAPPGLWTTSLATANTAGGDLVGIYPNPTIKPDVVLTGSPTLANVVPLGDNDQSIATTAFVRSTTATVSAEAFGAVGNGVADDTAALTAAIQAAITTSTTLLLRSGAVYRTISLLSFDVTGKAIRIATTGADQATILCDTTTPGAALTFSAAADMVSTTLAANQRINSSALTLTSVTGAQPGDLLRIKSNKSWYYEPREASGVTHYTGTAQAGTANTITLAAGADATTAYVGKGITIVSGTGVKQARTITAYDTGTKVATVARNWSTNPNNTSIYIVPEAFKGENHVITKVTGNVVELRLPTFDGYDVSTADGIGLAYEDVVIEIATPGRAVIDNIAVVRAQNGSTFADYCLRLNYLVDSRITNCLFDKGRDQGLSIVICVDTRVDNCGFRGMNNAVSTGYGCSVFNSTGTYVFRCWSYNCRRGVDVSGMETPSRVTTIDSCTFIGGGMASTGNPFGPSPTGTVEASYGCGSHAAADFTRYVNNRISNVTDGVVVRGANEHIEGNSFFGFLDCCVHHLCGAEIVIKNNTYIVGWRIGYTSDSTTVTHIREYKTFQGFGPANYTANFFYSRNAPPSVATDWIGVSEGATLIAGNVTKSASSYFIFWSSDEVNYVWSHLTVRDNHIFMDSSSVASEVGMIGRTFATTTVLSLDRATIQNNFLWDDGTQAELYTLGNGVAIQGTSSAGPATQLGPVNAYRLFLADDTAGSFHIRQRVPAGILRLEVSCTNSLSFLFTGWLTTATGVLTTAGSLVNVEGAATVLTGTTGTDARITISYVTSKLYVENRSGASRNIVVRLMPMD